VTLPNSLRLTIPLTISPTRSLYSSNWRLRSYDELAGLDIGFRDLRIGGADLCDLVFDLVGDLTEPPELHLAGCSVDFSPDIVLVPVLGPPGLGNGLFHRLENFVAFYRFFARDGIGHLQEFGP
jgi:hypothetical protein